MRLYTTRNVLLAAIVCAFVAGLFAHFIAAGDKTIMSLRISMWASHPVAFLFGGATPAGLAVALAIAHLLNIILFALPATVVFLLFRKHSPSLCRLVIIGWLGVYVLLLLFLFPAVPIHGTA